MLAVPALCQLAAQRVPRAGKQLLRLLDDCQAVFERHIAALVLLQQSAPVCLTRGRVMRIHAAAILLVEHTGLPETDGVVIERFDHEAQLADERKMLGLHADVNVQSPIAAKAACQAQRRAVSFATENLRTVRRHGSQYTPASWIRLRERMTFADRSIDGSPVIVTDAIEHWPARSKWTTSTI